MLNIILFSVFKKKISGENRSRTSKRCFEPFPTPYRETSIRRTCRDPYGRYDALGEYAYRYLSFAVSV